MEVPDKIYFPADGLPRYIDWDGSPIRTKQVEDSDICYIRKDALLEWLEKKVQLSYGVATDALVEVIEK